MWCSLVLLGCLITVGAAGQVVNADSGRLVAYNNLVHLYSDAMRDEKHVFNGKEYFNYDKYYMKGHQFYKSNEEQEGAIYYEGSWYTNVPMLYDIVLDQLVIPEPTGSLYFKLENKKVNFFNLHGHRFTRLVPDSAGPAGISAGFYDLLLDGKIQVIAKRKKNLFEEPTSRGMEGEFTLADKFYILKDNTYYQVAKKKSVLEKFPDKKKELQKYIRTQRLGFKGTSREAALIQLVAYYNSLL